MRNLTRRSLLLATGAAAGWYGSNLFRADLPVLDGTKRLTDTTPPGMLNDASGLSATPINRHITLNQPPDDSLIAALRAEMASARTEGRAFNIGAARHSMGGQAIPRDGIAVTFDNGLIEPDSAAMTYRAHAGARWSQVIAALDPLGFSPKVMQSNNDFGLAATFSVNAHGWPVPFGPMGSTVRSLRMVLPSGDLITASASENTEIFNLAMGGYGLIGAIVDLQIEMVPNTRLIPAFQVLPAEAFATAFRAAVDDPAVTMAYGRLNVERETFFQHALLITYREDADQADLPPAAGSGVMAHLASRFFFA